MTDLHRGICGLDADAPGFKKAADYYSGDTSEIFTSQKMARKLAKSNVDNLRINFSKVAVDAVASRIEISAVSSPDAAAEAVLDELWKDNQLDLELPGLFLRTLVFGESYLILDGDSESVDLFYNSPLTMKMFYSPENPRKKEFAIKRWTIPDPYSTKTLTRVNLFYPDRIERYVAAPGKTKAADFTPYSGPDEDDSDSTIPNIYGFIPVYHFKTSIMPSPEHKSTYGPQDAINKLAITHLATIDYLGFPQRYLMASSDMGDSSGVDDFDTDIFHDPDQPQATEPGPDSYRPGQGTYTNVAGGRYGTQPYSGLQADPGGIWRLGPGETPGQFDAADSKNFLDSLNTYIELCAKVSDTPMHYYQPQLGAPSGESLKAADAPLVKKVIARERSFEATLEDCLNDALTVLGYPNAEVAIHWVSPVTVDDIETWQVVTAKISNGVPIYTALQQAGFTDIQLETMAIQPGAKSKSLTDRALDVQNVGRGFLGFAAAVDKGLLTADQAVSIMNEMLSPDAPAIYIPEPTAAPVPPVLPELPMGKFDTTDPTALPSPTE